jgi:hypothetical protein
MAEWVEDVIMKSALKSSRYHRIIDIMAVDG